MSAHDGCQQALLSLYDEAQREADEFKWLESERRRQDVGRWGHGEWIRRYWAVFVRWKRLQHLYGHRRYIEFDDESFGRLAPVAESLPAALNIIAQRFIDDRWENLHYFWGCENLGCAPHELIDLLELIGINGLRRLAPPAWMIEAA